MHKSVCLCVCLFVHFFNPLPVVQWRHQGYIWKAYNLARKMKLFNNRSEREFFFRLGIMIQRKCLSVCHKCLFVCHSAVKILHTLILITLYTLICMFVCLSQFYSNNLTRFYTPVLPEGRAGGAVGAHSASILNSY